ncbi:MAG TPA: hypothetical protein VHI13_02395 [Candidatus Kapabacteria bacterium]|nr:hypothetical protein [Candidatus Kapabacteria bacterium]
MRFRIGLRLLVTAALLVTGITIASAQIDPPYVLPVGTRNTCNASVNATLSGQLVGPISVSGPATFEWVATSAPGAQIAFADLQPRAVGHGGNNPQYGNVTLNLDASRESANSRIEAQVAGQAFPATSRLRFQATVTVSSRPGVTYRSQSEIVIENTNLTHWPHNNDVYSQVGSTNFEDAAHPGIVVFTLSGASVTVTAAGQ